MTEKSVFREAWSPELTSQSYPTGSEICRFWHIKTRGRKIAIENIFLPHSSAHWGDLIEQIKKSVIYTLMMLFLNYLEFYYFLRD